MDFVFSRFFKKFKNLEFTYDFFEIEGGFNLSFSNLKVKISRTDLNGTIQISKAVVGFSEFMRIIKTQHITLSEATFNTISADLKLIEKKKSAEGNAEQKERRLKISARKAVLKNASFLVRSKPAKGEEKKDEKKITIGDLFIEYGALILSDPTEKYGAKTISVKDISLSKPSAKDIQFGTAEVNGRKQNGREAFLKALKRP